MPVVIITNVVVVEGAQHDNKSDLLRVGLNNLNFFFFLKSFEPTLNTNHMICGWFKFRSALPVQRSMFNHNNDNNDHYHKDHSPTAPTAPTAAAETAMAAAAAARDTSHLELPSLYFFFFFGVYLF